MKVPIKNATMLSKRRNVVPGTEFSKCIILKINLSLSVVRVLVKIHLPDSFLSPGAVEEPQWEDFDVEHSQRLGNSLRFEVWWRKRRLTV